MTFSIDLIRFSDALSQLESTVDRLQRDQEHWKNVSLHYSASMSVYQMMTPKEQSTVAERLDRLRVRCETLAERFDVAIPPVASAENFTRDERLWLTYDRSNGVYGRIRLFSANQHSLMIELEGSLRLPHGIYTHMIALLRKSDGHYHDLIHDTIVELHRQP